MKNHYQLTLVFLVSFGVFLWWGVPVEDSAHEANPSPLDKSEALTVTKELPVEEVDDVAVFTHDTANEIDTATMRPTHDKAEKRLEAALSEKLRIEASIYAERRLAAAAEFREAQKSGSKQLIYDVSDEPPMDDAAALQYLVDEHYTDGYN